MAREDKLEEGTLELSLQEGIERDNLIGIIDRVLGQHGCPACGLAGLDLELRTRMFSPQGVGSEDVPGFEDVPGLNGVRHRPAR
jgi:hypothetical protein